MAQRKICNLFVCFILTSSVSNSSADLIEDLDEIGMPKTGAEAKKDSEKPAEAIPSSTTSDSQSVKSEGPPSKVKGSNKNSSSSQAKPLDSRSEEVESKAPRQKEPIFFKSDGDTTYLSDGRTVLLEKNVVVTQADLRLSANKGQVYLLENDDVDKIVVEGNVRISQSSEDPAKKVVAKAVKGIFFNSRGVVQLIGNARLWRGDSLIKGEKIYYYLDSGKFSVTKAEGYVAPKQD